MRTPSGSHRVPPPTTIGVMNRRNIVDQTGFDRPSRTAGTANGEVAVRRRLHVPDLLFGVEVPSIRVFAVDAVTNVVEYTTLSAACQSPRSPTQKVAGRRPRARSPSTSITSYIRRPYR